MAEGTNLIVIDEGTYSDKVEKAEVPVLIDFYADWCGPCVAMAPIFKELAAEYEGKCLFAKLNVDENQEIAGKFQVMSIPTLVMASKGKEVDRIIGFSSKPDLKNKIDELLTKV